MTNVTPPTFKNKQRSYFVYRCPICGWECRKYKMPDSPVPVTKTGDYGSLGSPPGEVFYDEMYVSTTVSFYAANETSAIALEDDSGYILMEDGGNIQLEDAGISSTLAYLSDSTGRFAEKLFKSEMPIKVTTTSGTNDGEYTIAARGVSRGEILLNASNSLTTESASTAGTVTISAKKYKPNVVRGCPSCGSLNTRQGD